ncbi:MAG TPA: DUF2939 domain-containing protein [Bradyrhizobium sp.]|jgi:hypothetical protein|nr:DUF2939 domain-containing protein [Bradyrhizobium sp.]
MRWLVGIVITIVLLMVIYLGSAAYSLAGLIAAAREGNGAAVMERIDMPSLRRSLTDQIVAAWLERVGSTRRVSPMEKMLVNTYGATVADAMVAKLLTAERLTQILRTGNLDATAGVPNLTGLPPLADLQSEDWLSLLARVSFVQPVLLAIRVSKASDPDNYAAINLHYEGLDWKLSGIVLPKAAVRDLAASLPMK